MVEYQRPGNKLFDEFNAENPMLGDGVGDSVAQLRQGLGDTVVAVEPEAAVAGQAAAGSRALTVITGVEAPAVAAEGQQVVRALADVGLDVEAFAEGGVLRR